MNESTPGTGMTRLQKILLGLLLVLLVGSVAARAAFQGTREDASANSTLHPAGFLASTEKSAPATTAHEGTAGTIESALPYVTEGSLFGLIGFALGYATRKIFKLALLVIALVFIGIQVAVHFGWMSVDWSSVTDWLNRAVLNLKENESVTKFLTNRVPSAGALGLGALVGFKRG